jgi:hypothetical protein
VKKEMTQEKGLDPTVADKIGQYVKLKGAGLEGKHRSPVPSSVLTLTVTRGTETVATTPAGFHPYLEQERERRSIRHNHPFHPPTVIWCS